MNDSRCRPTTSWASRASCTSRAPGIAGIVGIAASALLMAACGSGAQGSVGGGGTAKEEREAVQPRRSAMDPNVAVPAGSKAQAELDDNVSGPSAVGQHDPGYFLCMRDPVAFDLSKLEPSGATVGFQAAWLYAKQHSEMPGFAVVYAGTARGPSLKVQVGAVRHVNPEIYTFMRTLPGSSVVDIGLEQGDPFHVMTTHRSQNFVTAFGKPTQREGFVISDITVEGELDHECRSLRHVSVTMTLPRENNAAQRFGGWLLGDALGPTTVDSHHRGVPDAWSVTLVGESLDSMMFSL